MTTTPTTPCGPSSPVPPSTASRSARSVRRRLNARPTGDGVGTDARPTAPGGRDVRVELHGDDPKRLNDDALADLDGGATSLWLHAGPDTDLAVVLDGVLLDLAPVVLEATTEPVTVAERFLAHLGDTTAAAGTNLGVGADASDDELVAVARLALGAGVLGVVVDASAVHDRGASEAQELGWSIVAAARVLRVLEAAGIPVARAAGLVEFRYAATDEQFLDHRQAAGGPAALVPRSSRSAGPRRSTSGSTPSPAGR